VGSDSQGRIEQNCADHIKAQEGMMQARPAFILQSLPDVKAEEDLLKLAGSNVFHCQITSGRVAGMDPDRPEQSRRSPSSALISSGLIHSDVDHLGACS
jgi:hypothetical protein